MMTLHNDFKEFIALLIGMEIDEECLSICH